MKPHIWIFMGMWFCNRPDYILTCAGRGETPKAAYQDWLRRQHG